MHCLLWWLPIFLLPLPAASPFLCLLFIVTYAVRMRPCAYCAIIIVGLLFVTCTLYSDDAISLLTASTSKARNASISGSASMSQPSSGHVTTNDASAARIADAADRSMPSQSVDGRQYAKQKGAARSLAASTCWLDFTGSTCGTDEQEQHTRSSQLSTLGWLTAPTKRGRRTLLGEWQDRRVASAQRQVEEQARQAHEAERGLLQSLSRWVTGGKSARPRQRDTTLTSSTLHQGLWIGWGDIGFRLKLYVD